MRTLAWLVVVALTVGVGAPLAEAQTSSGEIVVAQADERRGGLFRRLFGKRDRSLRGPRDRIRKLREQRRERIRSSSRAPAPAAPPRPDNYSVAKLSDAPPELDEAKQRVLVAGDFMAKALAQGLADAFAENPNIEVISAGNGSSGLVRDDFYDWMKALPEFADNYKPEAIVVMIGGNDRQAIRAGGTIQPRTEEWDAAYRARVSAFMDTLKATGRPIFWAGLVPVRSPGMSRDYSGFNTIYREKAPASGIVFIEMWNGFADSDGRFVSRGPDVNGQDRQLRVSDGLNFTGDGRRKLAFFVERDLRQVLKASGGPQFASLPATDEDAGASSVSALISLDTYAGDAGSGLSTFGEAAADAAEGEEAAEAAAEPILAVGRVDDYQWPRPAPVPAEQPVEQAGEEPGETPVAAAGADG